MEVPALQVQECLKRDTHAGNLQIFRSHRGDMTKILLVWPSAPGGAVSKSAARMAYMLEGIEWRNPQLRGGPIACDGAR